MLQYGIGVNNLVVFVVDRSAAAAIIVYDVTNSESFEKSQTW